MKRKLIINGKEYEMPKMDVDTYMEYLEVRDDIMGTEKKSGLYTQTLKVEGTLKFLETYV